MFKFCPKENKVTYHTDITEKYGREEIRTITCFICGFTTYNV